MNKHSSIPLGDGVAHMAVLIWVSLAVGPWWLGAVIMAGATIINLLQRRHV